MLRRSRGGHWYRPPVIRIAALEKAAPQHPRTEPDGVTGSSPAVQCSACAPAATPQTDTRVSATPVAAAAGASVSEENASPAQLPREDSGYCAVEGWSISSALLSVFALAPTIAGHCCGSRTSFHSFMSAMTHLLPVPETHTRQAQLCLPSSDRAPAASSSASTSGLLFDALTLPCHVCRHASPFSARLATPWAEWVTQGRGSGQHPLQSSMPPSRWCNPPLSPPVSAGEENASSSPAATGEPTVWTTKSMYADAQVCADASADALRAFAGCRLHQRVPQLQLLAERPYAMGDEVVESCAAPRDVADAAEAACVEARNAEQLSLATRRVPVETYVERTLLSRTTGTAALQLALRRALQSPSTTAWWKTEPATTGDDSTELAAMAPAASHFLWNGRDWTLEVDPQLVEMEERLLQAQKQQSNKNSGCEGCDTLTTRAWLRSHYPSSSVTVLMPPVQTSGAEIASPLGAWPDDCSVFPADSAPHDPQSGGNLFAREARCGSLLTPCASWIFRLRKSWLVTGLHSHMPHRACVSDAHASGEDNNSSSSSSSVFGASFSQRMPQVNYDLITGAPLRLKWQRSTRGKWEIVPAAAPERRQKIKEEEEAMHEQSASVDPLCGNVAGSSVCDAEQQRCQPPPSPLSTATRGLSSPFSYAIRSRRVGWMPVKRTRPFAPEKNIAAPTTSVSWSLPPALHAFDLPTNPAAVPEPLLTDHDPQDPASLCCGAVVPREEWYAGFFAHDAPAWWERAVSSALRRSASTTRQPPSQQVQENREDTACAQNNADKFEKDALLAPPHLLQRLVDLNYVPALPDEAISASQAEPLLCVLQLRAAAPRVRRDKLRASTIEKGGGGDVQLCWSVHDGTTATATVNFAFTLADVSSGGTALTLSSTPSPALCFVELKAGLEVLRRVTHGSESASGVQSVMSTSWWSRLECFYRLNTAEMTAVERQAAQTQDTSSTRHSTLSGVGPDTSQSARGGTSRGHVTAASHPSTTEVAQKLLRFIAAGDHIEAREQKGKEEEDKNKAEIITRHGGEHQKEEEKWEAAPMDVLARSGGAATRAFAMHWRRSEQHDRLHRTLAALSTAESPTTPHAEEKADTDERGSAEDVAESPSVQLLPFGVEVHTYDEDGTRIYEAERSHHAEGSEGDDEEESEDAADADEETLTAAAREAATAAAAAAASSPVDSGSSGVRHSSRLIRGGTTRDWPALDRRCFAQRHHRLEDAMKPPGRSHHPVQSILRHERRQQNQKASTTPDAAPSRLCLPLSPPISVSALGIDRALAITAAQAETKRYGFPSAHLPRQSPAALPSMFHQHHLLRGLFSDTAAAVAAEENAVRPVEEENQASCHAAAHNDSKEDIAGATRPSECTGLKVAESSTPLSRTCARTSLVGPPAAIARSASTTLSEQSVRMDLDSTATLLPDLIAELIRDERRRFKDLWKPWLSYLPPESSAPSAVGSATHDADEALHVVPPRDPRWIFPFLQSSRVEACHIRQNQQKSADQTPPPSPVHKEIQSHERELHKHLLNPHVVSYDIGISLLQIRTNDTYVNAFNLLLRDSPRRPPNEANRTTWNQ